MFKDLKNSWQDVVNYSVDDGKNVSIPHDLFKIFQQEFNICFVEQDDDEEFIRWNLKS